MEKSKRWIYVRLFAFIPVILWMYVIFGFSGDNGETSSSKSDKVAYIAVNSCNNIFHLGMDEEQVENAAKSIVPYIRKLAHFTEYMILALLIVAALWINSFKLLPANKIRTYIVTVIIVLIYASTDEIHQLFVPGRCGSPIDVMIDTSGGTLGAIFMYVVMKIKTQKTVE